MASCPRCGTQLKEEYGMSQCTSCGAFSFIDMDGNAAIAETSDQGAPADPMSTDGFPDPFGMPGSEEPNATPADPFQGNSLTQEIEVNEPVQEQTFDPSPSMSLDQPIENSADFGDQSFAPPAEDVMAQAEAFESIDMFAPVADAPAEDGPTSDIGFGTDSASENGSSIPRGLGPVDDPLGLSDFAKSEISQAKDGPLLFTVFISGIDSKEIRDSIREAIEDSRFQWDAHAVLSGILRGQLTIENLSPVKAMILIGRLKRLPIELRWEQNAISQPKNLQ